MPVFEVLKEHRLGFARRGAKPLPSSALIRVTDKFEHKADLKSWFMFKPDNHALIDGASVTLDNNANLTHEGLIVAGGNDNADPSNSSTLDTVATGDFTVHIRVHPTNTGNTNRYVMNSESNKFAVIFGFASRQYETFFDGGDFRRTIKTLDVGDTVLHTISIAREGSQMRIYFDGVEVINEAWATTALSGTWHFGSSTGTGANFDGTISDIVFVNAAQSPAFCQDFGRDIYRYLESVVPQIYTFPEPVVAGGRIMGAIAGAGGLAGRGGIAGPGGGIAG